MESSKQQILEYEKRALNSIPDDHPHSQEIRKLLIDQVNDDLQTNGYTRSNRRTG